MKPYFRGIAKKLKAHIEDISSEFGHRGEQGASNEKIITRVLEDYLPKKYSVGRGKILAQNDQDTSQIDVIIYDPYLCSPLYTEEDFMVAGIESVYGVVEVKTTLDKSELLDANNKAASVLTKPRLDTIIRRMIPGGMESSGGPTAPPISVCFAFQSKTSLA